jgi:hypothetical protein
MTWYNVEGHAWQQQGEVGGDPTWTDWSGLGQNSLNMVKWLSNKVIY